MFIVRVHSQLGAPVGTFQIAKHELTIGSAPDDDLVVPRPDVAKRHLRIVGDDGIDDDRELEVVDVTRAHPTYLNGARIDSTSFAVSSGDKLAIGGFVFAIECIAEVDWLDEPTHEDIAPFDERAERGVHLGTPTPWSETDLDPAERRLLAAIAQHDDASWLVYADWLEEHGHHARAEFLRVQRALETTSPDAPAFRERSDRLRVLAPSIDLGWRYKVARPAIENCVAIELPCPKEWGALAITERDDVRHCGACARNVYYCTTVADALHHAHHGQCVAIDVANSRRPDDLRLLRMPMLGAPIARRR